MQRILLLVLFFSFLPLTSQDLSVDSLDTEATLIQFRNSDLLQSVRTDTVDLKKLIGNVVLEQGDITFKCDSAYLFPETNEMEAFGKVHIQQGDSLNIYGDYLRYLGNDKRAYIYDNVRLSDDKTKINGDTLIYSIASKRALIYKGIRVVDETNNITADSLEYFVNSKNANFYGDVKFNNGSMKMEADTMNYNMLNGKGSFRGGGKVKNRGTVIESEVAFYDSRTQKVTFDEDVHLIDPQYDFRSSSLDYDEETGRSFFGANTVIKSDSAVITGEQGWYQKELGQFSIWDDAKLVRGSNILSGDSLFFDNNKSRGRAYQNVVFEDTVNNYIVESDYIEYAQENGDFLASQDPLMKIIMGPADTLFLRADTLKTSEAVDTTAASGLGAFSAFHKVAIYSQDFQASCDSLEYSFTDSLFQFFENPILWVENTQLIADSIQLRTANRKAEEINMRRDCMIISPETDAGIYNQLSGDIIDGYFTDNQISSFEIQQEAKSIYFAKDDSARYIGVNESAAEDMTIWFEDQKVSKIKFVKEPKSTYSPLSKVDAYALKLEGFQWYEELRPKSKEDLLKIRLIERKVRETKTSAGATVKNTSTGTNEAKRSAREKGKIKKGRNK